jgi:hypothetical protein
MSDDEPTPVDIEIHRWCGLRVEGRVVDRRSDLTVAGRHRGIRGATADLRESEIALGVVPTTVAKSRVRGSARRGMDKTDMRVPTFWGVSGWVA